MRTCIPIAETLHIIFPCRCMLCGCILTGADSVVPGLCNSCLKRVFQARIHGDVCRVCGRPLISTSGTCLYCRENDFEFEWNTSLFIYEEPVRTLIRMYKFHSQRQLAYLWAFLLNARLKQLFSKNSSSCLSCSDPVIVPVPGRRSSVRKRGWDQVELIGVILRTRYDVHVADILTRSGSRSQKELGYQKRILNLRGNIKLRRTLSGFRHDVPEHVVLLDDIFTTGATLNECARVCKLHGAVHVYGLTIAKALY
ncbi:MAG: ComF family protein [Sediminispirochaetaceae bacterium]